MIQLIKIISTVAIISAIGLEIANFYIITASSWFKVPIWLASFALVSHLIEGIIAGVVAQRRRFNPWKAGIYTFFTGTAGLTEILKAK